MLWEVLREGFIKVNHFRFSDLLQDLHSIKQVDKSLSQCFANLKILWYELEDLCPTLSYSCPNPCTHDVAKVVPHYKHMEYVSSFLKRMNDPYNNIYTHKSCLCILSQTSVVCTRSSFKKKSPCLNCNTLTFNLFYFN